MRKIFKSTWAKAILFLLCALILGVGVSAIFHGTLPETNALSVLTKPINSLSSKIASNLNWFSSSFASSNSLKKENAKQKEEIEKLQGELVGYDEMKQKVESYEQMFDIKQKNPDFALCSANIIGSDDVSVFSSFVIDAGKNDKVKVGDPVCCGDYFVGIVKKVNKTSSLVSTLLNEGVTVSAIDSSSRESSYVTTDIKQAENGKCVMKNLKINTAISPGGIIVTSGVGRLCPKGLIIGTVDQILFSEHDYSSYAVITPKIKFNELEEVFVITDFKGQGEETIEITE